MFKGKYLSKLIGINNITSYVFVRRRNKFKNFYLIFFKNYKYKGDKILKKENNILLYKIKKSVNLV